MRYESAIRSALASVFLSCGLACAVCALFVPDALAKKPPPGPPPPPALSFSPQTSGSFDYGTVGVGGIASQDFTLTNNSGSSTSLAVRLDGSSAFAVVVDSCTGISLPNGRSCVVVVSYTSTTPSGDTATLTAAGAGKKAQAFPTSLTLNGSGGGAAHLYWSSQDDGYIRKANLDGSDVQVIVTDSNVANGMAVSSSRVYWTGGDEWCGGTIRSANLDGSGEATIVTGQNCAWGLAVDASHLYWANSGDGTLHRANLDGSNPVTLVTDVNISAVAVDSSHVYWAGSGGVHRANLDGSDVQLVYSTYSACTVAVDDSHVYLDECNGAPLIRADLDGSNAFYFPSYAEESLSLYGGRIYWSWNASRIDVADIDGSNLQENLFWGGPGGVNALAVGGQ
jgi:hypothetical protein